jgi:N-acetylglucosamine malate deacetylase 1
MTSRQWPSGVQKIKNIKYKKTIMKNKKILCIGAHPDDLEVGMGGTIAKLVSKNYDVQMLVVLIKEFEKIRIRETESKNSALCLGAKIDFIRLDLDEMSYSRKLVQKFDKYINEMNPHAVFTHWIGDSHQDHQIIANTTITSLRKNKCSLYMYEQCIPGGITSSSFKPQLFVNIDNFIEKKIDALIKHESQITKLNNQGSWVYGVKGRAQYRGYQINCNYAEAFEVIKDIREF